MVVKRKKKATKAKRAAIERLPPKPARERIAALDKLYEARQISQAQHDAGVRLRSDYETAHGAGGGQSEKVDGTRASYGPSDIQLDAVMALRRALRAVGDEHALVLLAAVCRGLSMRSAAAEVELSDKTVSVRVIAGLVELEQHYEEMRRERRKTLAQDTAAG